MKLTKADREYLKRNFWEDDAHIDQIESAIKYTSFELELESDGKTEKISLTKALELCGRELFLSSMDRSAFHRSATLSLGDGRIIYFDSNRYFRSKSATQV